jgi:quinol-cytochrome oxidoreductase complex cytochrome b subunit
MSHRILSARAIVLAWILGVVLASLSLATAFAGSLGTGFPR